MGWSTLNYIQKQRHQPLLPLGAFISTILMEYLKENGRKLREGASNTVRATTCGAAAQLFGAESVAAVARSPQVSQLLRAGLTSGNDGLAAYQRGAFLHASTRPSCLVPGVSRRPRALLTRGGDPTDGASQPTEKPRLTDGRGDGAPQSINDRVRTTLAQARAHARAVKATPGPVRGGGGRARVAAWWDDTYASGSGPT